MVALKFLMNFRHLATLWLEQLEHLQDEPQGSLVKYGNLTTCIHHIHLHSLASKAGARLMGTPGISAKDRVVKHLGAGKSILVAH